MRKFISIVCLLLSFELSFAQTGTDSLRVEASTSEKPGIDGSLWDAANAAYVACDYEAAIASYKAILDGGQFSFELYNNIGCSYLKAGNIGLGILYFHRALRLRPASEDARFNLEYAQSKTKDNIQSIPEFFLIRWMHSVRSSLSCSVWSVLSVVSFAMILVFAAMFFVGTILRVRKTGFYGALGSLLLFIAVTSFAVSSRATILEHNEAILLSSAISVKSSPDSSATDLFVIHEGAFLRIINEVDDWYEVSLSDGKKGWLKKNSLERI
ncbi:MAG: SH3 domain-containing protein [Alistipes sp.]|nr:SH3 domain-containing protein [Candidatus Alistipes equi]